MGIVDGRGDDEEDNSIVNGNGNDGGGGVPITDHIHHRYICTGES